MGSAPRDDHTQQETSTEYARPFRPRPIGALNALGRGAQSLGLPGASLSEASLIAAARRRSGLHDFGDQSFRRPMRILLEALELEAELHPLGRLMARENMIRVLVNHLRIQADLDRHPEILDRPLEPPVFIAGLQRTGTTVLHRLFAQDPGLRTLASWEAVNPAPLPKKRHNGVDPRVKAARLAETALRYLSPDFFAIHPVEADSPEEDCLLIDYCFMSTVPEATQQVPTFSAWLEEQDHREAYRYLATVLRYLQWQRPSGRWVLKSPHHLEHLDTIHEVFPGAHIVFPHRDPSTALASFCSMMSHAYGIFSDHVDPVEVGHRWLRKTSHMVACAMETRRELGEAPFIDVRYEDLVQDPLAEMRRIYQAIDRELTDDIEARMRAWIGRNPQHKHGRHRYALEDFGLDRQLVREGFSDYLDRFFPERQGGSDER